MCDVKLLFVCRIRLTFDLIHYSQLKKKLEPSRMFCFSLYYSLAFFHMFETLYNNRILWQATLCQVFTSSKGILGHDKKYILLWGACFSFDLAHLW